MAHVEGEPIRVGRKVKLGVYVAGLGAIIGGAVIGGTNEDSAQDTLLGMTLIAGGTVVAAKARIALDAEERNNQQNSNNLDSSIRH